MATRRRFPNMMRLVVVCCLFLGSMPLPARAGVQIAEAFEAGILDYETALLYEVYAVRDPESLPTTYRPSSTAPHQRCGTAALVAAQQAAPVLSASFRAKLARALQRPARSSSLVTASGRFRIHYDLDGRHGVDPADADESGIPDYIEEIAATMERAWNLEVVELGYRAPLEDGGVGGGNEYDVYVSDLSQSRVYGLAFPELSADTTPVYFELDNNFTDPVYVQTRGLDALHVTVAHEFFHGVQFAYYAGRTGVWWQEASSTWMEEVAYPEVDDYLQYVPSVLRQPERALESGNFTAETRIYGSAIFAHFLAQRFDRDLIRSVWEEMGVSNHARLVNFERAIRRWIPGGLGDAIAEYAVWNYFTGANHRPGEYYVEGSKYGQVRVRTLQTPSKVAVTDSGQVDHTGSAYVRLEPQLQSGGVVIELKTEEGSWKRQLLLIAQDAVEVRSVEENPVEIAAWDRYDEVVVVLSSIEQSGTGFEYSVGVEYNPNLLGDGPSPQLQQNAPNPFNSQTIFSYFLPEPGLARLEVFALTGQRVTVLHQGHHSAGIHRLHWDGHDHQGRPLASGIYLYRLVTAEGVLTRKLVLLRAAAGWPRRG